MAKQDIHEFRVRVGKPGPAIAIYNLTNGKESGDSLDFASWEDAIAAVDQLRKLCCIEQNKGWLSMGNLDGR